MDLSKFAGVRVRIRGDGRSYQIRFRLDGSFDGVSYAAEFETTSGEWMEVDLPFKNFQPTFRGRVPRGAGPLDPGRIRQMGILIGDKKEGPFKLEMAWIKAYGGVVGTVHR
jgi:monofunctional biosynthetic peptidoglycan transglycosylase